MLMAALATGLAVRGDAAMAAVAPTSSATTPSAAEAQPALLTTMAEPPMAWPVSAEPRAAAPMEPMDDDHSERPGLGFTPPAPAGYTVDPEGPNTGASKTEQEAGSTAHGGTNLQDSFPAIPGHLAGLLTSCTEKEMVQLFDQFTGYPLSEPVVSRIIEQYIPLRALAMQEKIWTQKYQKATDKSGLTEDRGLHRPAGDMPFHSMCGKCMTPWPDNATRCWTCKHDQAIEYQRPTSIMEVGDETGRCSTRQAGRSGVLLPRLPRCPWPCGDWHGP